MNRHDHHGHDDQDHERRSPGVHAHPAAGTANGPVLKDVVCGMTVKPTTAHRTTHGGQEYLFCNPRCLEKFRADPERYLAPKPAAEQVAHAPQAVEVVHTCPMHPEVRH